MIIAKKWLQILLGVLLYHLATAGIPANYVDGAQCYRPCGGPKMKCYFHFNVENVYSMSKACFACPFIMEDCFRQDCIIGGGRQRTLTVVNRQIPGPSIEVCRGDTVKIVVENNLLSGESTSLHWHGILMKETPFMDGVPFVTQCPLHSGNSFTYKFTIDQSGTYIWHGHLSFQKGDGLFGNLVVRDSKENNYHAALYDFDKSEHVIIMVDWSEMSRIEMFQGFKMGDIPRIYSNGFLINGLGYQKNNDLPLANFDVTQGYRYRFRLVNVGFAECPFEISIDNHTMLVIAADAADIEPVEVNTIMMHSGERYDIVVNANQPVDTYWIRIKGYLNCADKQVFSLATLTYTGSCSLPQGPFPDYSTAVSVSGVMLNHLDPVVDPSVKVITVNQLKAINTITDELRQEEFIKKFYLSFDMARVDSPYYNRAGYYGYAQVAPNYRRSVPQINNIAFENPSVNLLAGKRLNEVNFCDIDSLKESNCSTNYCQCTHTIETDVGDVVEMILIEPSQTSAHHPIHLHGFIFYVLAQEKIPGNFTRNDVIRMDEEGQLKRNLINPPLKDTVDVPVGGYTIIRFVADNPGVWLLHCHLGNHIAEGMKLILKVGNYSEMQRLPSGFPTCGNY